MKPSHRLAVIGVFGLVNAFLVCHANAQISPADEERAAALYNDAYDALEAGDYATACPKFEEVIRIKPGLGARITLGDCYQRRGDLVLAIEMFETVLRDAPAHEAKAVSPDEKQKVQSRAAEAEKHVTELREKLGSLRIEIPDAQRVLPGFAWLVDGTPIPPEKIGAPRWCLPGKHLVEVSATGFATARKEIELKPGDAPSIRIELVPLPPPVVVNPPPIATKKPTKEPTGGSIPAWAWSAGGVGLVALGVAAGFAFDYRTTRNAAAKNCADGTCNAPGLADAYESTWNRDLGLAAGLGAVGVVGIGVFVIGSLSGHSSGHENKAIAVVPWIMPGSSGMQLSGSF